MKKILTLLLASSLLLISGCSGNSNQPSDGTDKAEGTESISADPPKTSTEYTVAEPPSADMSEAEQRELMINNSLMTVGDTSRMINVMKKADAGEEITVGFIGGSITEGLTAGDDLCYAKLTHGALSEMFGSTTVNYVNAGLSGTPSVLGVVRAERDLFSGKQPDIIFIEFAVNDGGEQQYKDCYESLVKKCLDKENQPAVVLLFTVLKNRYSCQPQMAAVGEHYGLPMISVGNALNPMFDKVKAEADGMDSAPAITPLPDTAVYTTEYSNMELLERDQMNVTDVSGFSEVDSIRATFNNGWLYYNNTGGSVTFTAEFKTLFLVFDCNSTYSFADAEVYIDGELVNTLPSSKSGGWGNPEADRAWTGTECKEHTVEIKIAPTEKDVSYGLIGVGVGK